MLEGRRRILVIGSSGAGKTTFARELARLTGLPLVHLDRMYWRPGWERTPRAEWEKMVRDLATRESWILDGNYGGSLTIRLDRCDAVVFFDFPRRTCMRGVLQRWLVHKFRSRPDLAEGCPERLDAEFLRWVWNYRRDSRPRILAAVEGTPPAVEKLILVDRSEARAVLRALERSPTGGAWPR